MIKKIIIFAYLILSISSCGVGFSNPVHVPEINLAFNDQDNQKPYKETDILKDTGSTYYIRSTEDKRLNKNFISLRNNNYSSDADLSPVVRESVSLTLEKMGFKRTKESPITLRLFITEWNAQVEEGMSPILRTKAKISLDVFDPTEKRIYKGEYSGSAELQGPSLDNEDLRKTLSSAMEQSIKQIILDKGLIKVLKSY